MADTVQYLLEESIPELEDYEARGYFTKAELRQIIQKRQDFEYRLKRRAAMKVDYYRCDDEPPRRFPLIPVCMPRCKSSAPQVH